MMLTSSNPSKTPYLFWGAIAVLAVLFWAYREREKADEVTAYLQHIQQVRMDKDRFLRADSASPLPHPELHKRLAYYPIDPAQRFALRLIAMPSDGAYWLETTEGTRQAFLRVGWVQMPLPTGGVYPLVLVQPIGQRKLLLAFTDATTGEETNNLGRYVEVDWLSERKVLIDFNKAYNPYCTYNPALACPLPPIQNDLPIAIVAGERQEEMMP